jgi:SAM-dependent methyltransferase
MSSPVPIATAQREPRAGRTALQKVRRGLEVYRTHVAMFGYVSALRAGLSRLVGPNYGREDFDAAYGVDTREASLIESQIPSQWVAEAIRYEPVNVGVLHHIFRSLPFRHEGYHLVDVGCGKGRTLMVGAEYPFRAITGIELSPRSVRIATDNLSRSSRRAGVRCSTIDVRCENAVDFTVPPGDLFVTLYNPFIGKTFEHCIEHLHRAVLAQPARKVWLAYINPWLCEETLEQSTYFRRVQQHRPIPRNWAWSLWQHV